MAANGRFKKALFGFRKSAVLDYVEAYQKDSRATIESLSDELSACKNELVQANAVNAELEAKLAECEDALRELNELAASLQAKIEELAAASADTAEEPEEAEPEPTPVEEEPAPVSNIKSNLEATARHFSEKLSRFDRMLDALRKYITGEHKK